MPATDIQRLGLLGSDSLAIDTTRSADSGATALATGTTANTITATVGTLFDGTQPLVRQGWAMLSVYGLTSTPYIATVDITFDDGTHTAYGPCWINASHTAAQGLQWVFPLFASLDDSMTTIKDVIASVTMSANAVTGSARLVFYGSP
jgi:hypothetical protein